MASRIAAIVLLITLFINGRQTLGLDKFVNNIKPAEAANRKFQPDINKTPKQIKEQLLPNPIEKKDELELNKHSEALKEIDEKLKTYQPNQGSSIIPSLISNQQPNDQQTIQDKLSQVIPPINQASSLNPAVLIQPIGSNSNLLNQPIGSNSLNLPSIDLSPINQPNGLNLQNKLPMFDKQKEPLLDDLNHPLADTLVKNQLPIANQQLGQIFDKIPQLDQQQNQKILPTSTDLFNHLQNQEQTKINPINKQQGLYNNLFNQQPNYQSLFNKPPFDHNSIKSIQDVLKTMELLSSFLPKQNDQPSTIGLANNVMHSIGHTGTEFPTIGQNFINKAPILPHKENIIYMLLNNLGMTRENTIVIPIQI